MFEKILIVGLGLIGGSFAKYLRSIQENVYIVAIDPNLKTCQEAVKYKVVDKAFSESALLDDTQFELVIVASPLNDISNSIIELSKRLEEPCMFLDFGSTKHKLKNDIELEKLYHVYVGGHPLTGSHTCGFGSSKEALFEGSTIVLTGTEKNAIEQLSEWFRYLKMRVIELAEDEHDKLLALSSHIPYFMSLLTLSPVRDLEHLQKKMLKQLVAGGFKDTTRVSQSSLSWGLALCQHNSSEILPALKSIRQHLEMLIDLMEQGDIYGLEVLIQVLSEQRELVVDS